MCIYFGSVLRASLHYFANIDFYILTMILMILLYGVDGENATSTVVAH